MAGKFEIKQTANGKFHFNLKVGNCQENGRSEMYSGNAGMENGIESVIKNASDAEIVDTTNA